MSSLRTEYCGRLQYGGWVTPTFGSRPIDNQYRWRAESEKGAAIRHAGIAAAKDDEPDPEDYQRPAFQSPDLDIASMVMAAIEDAVMLLRQGDPRKKPAETKFARWKAADACQDWQDAIYWMFYELDPFCERVFSLEWCVEAINSFTGLALCANRIREDAQRYLPRTQGSKVRPIRPLGVGK